jgi:osmotically-inducible protein OsmY
LAVAPADNIADKLIADDIVGALSRNTNVKAENVQLEVVDGKVTLSGKVSTWNAASAAYNAVQHTAGVIDIRNHLVVEPTSD